MVGVYGQSAQGATRVFGGPTAGNDVSSNWSQNGDTSYEILQRTSKHIYSYSLRYRCSYKSTAYKIAVDDPLRELSAKVRGLAVQDYTRKGLMHHLVEHSRRAIIVYPEMSEFLDLVLKKQNDLSGERQLYCKLFDGSKWTDTRIGKEGNRIEVENLCVSVGGFAQSSVYLDQLMSLVNRNDGFLERFLTWVAKLHLLNCDEVRDWGERLLTFSMQEFNG